MPLMRIIVPHENHVDGFFLTLVHVSNLRGRVAGSMDFACATLPTPLDFQAEV